MDESCKCSFKLWFHLDNSSDTTEATVPRKFHKILHQTNNKYCRSSRELLVSDAVPSDKSLAKRWRRHYGSYLGCNHLKSLLSAAFIFVGCRFKIETIRYC